MWRSIALVAALPLLLAGQTAAAGPMADPQSSRSRVDLQVVPAEMTQQLTLKDDSRLYGRIESSAVFDEGGADRGTTRARGTRSALPLPSSVTGSIVIRVPPLRLCRSKCVHLAPAAVIPRRRSR